LGILNTISQHKSLPALLSGVLIGLSYPPLPLGFLAWFGFIPLFLALKECDLKEAFKYGYLGGITAHFITLYWIGFNSGAGFFPVFLSLISAVFYLSLFWGLFTLILCIFLQKKKVFLWFSPLIWIAMEWIRSLGTLGFPWIDLALTQSRFIPLIQLLDVTGSSGISLWILILNVLLYFSYESESGKLKYALAAVGIVSVLWMVGLQKINNLDNNSVDNSVNVAVTQPSVDPNEKWERDNRKQMFELMHQLLDKAMDLGPDLIVWPETALPSYLRLSGKDRSPIQEKVNMNKIPLFSGTIDREKSEDGKPLYFNGSIFFQPHEPPEMYHKVKLVPFAEYVPLSGYFPKLNDLNFGQGNFTAGKEFTLFQFDNFSFSNLICYESSLPEVVRKFVLKGAEFITVQANDGWLGKTSGPYQHFEIAKLRAVENRRSIVRSANTGISGIILPSGKILEKKMLGERAVFKGDISLSNKITIYTKFGNILGKCSVIFIILCTGIISWSKKI
jgi:apolipoprotein N-acyltransferase